LKNRKIIAGCGSNLRLVSEPRQLAGEDARPTHPSKRKRPHSFLNAAFIYAGNDLLSHTLSRAVPSAQRGLTTVFGMGTGGSPAVRSPTSLAAFGYWLMAISFCRADARFRAHPSAGGAAKFGKIEERSLTTE
jgi:hypothetical protein